MAVPVYVFTGFLDAGKTTFIQDTMCDKRFNAGERTLILLFEEGEEEYDISAYPHKNVVLQVMNDQSLVTEAELSELVKKNKAERVIIETNGMQLVGDLYQKMPDDWEVWQEVMFADAGTILAYNSNMRQLVVDKMSGCEMVIFNRVPPDADIMPLHKLARSINRKVQIVYEKTDDTTQYDEIEDPLPFDINAPVIEIGDDDYGLFYQDLKAEPKKYDGKTVRFKAQVANLKKDRDGMFAPGRFVMTCCVQDIQFMGIPCKWAGSASLEPRSWVTVEGKMQVRFHSLYKGVGPVMTATSVVPAEKADRDYCSF